MHYSDLLQRPQVAHDFHQPLQSFLPGPHILQRQGFAVQNLDEGLHF